MILVTGATGLLGSHVLVELIQAGYTKIRALYRNEERIEEVKELFQYYFHREFVAKWRAIEWFQGDILDIPKMEEAMKDVTYVYHCAALVSFHRRDFNQLVKVNRLGTENMVNLALEHKVQHFCHVSSTAAIGKKGSFNGEISEENKWEADAETSGYAHSKWMAEKEVWRGMEEGLNAVIVNPSVIIGPGNWDESSLTIFRTVSKGLRFYTPGANATVDARDVAKIMLQLVDASVTSERFLCIGSNQTFKELLSKIALRMGKKQPNIAAPRFLGELTWRVALLLAFLRGKKASLTKESVQSAYSTLAYSNEKIKNQLHFSFHNLGESIDNAVFYKEWQAKN